MLKSRIIGLAFAAAALTITSAPAISADIEDKLVIVTSYPKDLTSVFQREFQKRHPGTKVEVLNKKTSAGIKYIQETARNNKSDLFWASAPDAFEVLKGDGLLQKYVVKAAGNP